MGPASKQNQHVPIPDHTGTGLGAGIGTFRQRSSPSSGREVQLPEVIESGGCTCTTSKYIHTTFVRIVDCTMGISFTDGVDIVLHRLVGP